MAKVQFKTKLSGDGKTMSYVEVSERQLAAFGGKKRVPVQATLNGYSYPTTICSMGGVFAIPVRREIRLEAKLEPGDELKVVLEEDLVPRKVSVPADLRRALKRSSKVFERFQKLSYTHQKEHVTSVLEAKRPETRQRRIARVVEAVTARM